MQMGIDNANVHRNKLTNILIQKGGGGEGEDNIYKVTILIIIIMIRIIIIIIMITTMMIMTMFPFLPVSAICMYQMFYHTTECIF